GLKTTDRALLIFSFSSNAPYTNTRERVPSTAWSDRLSFQVLASQTLMDELSSAVTRFFPSGLKAIAWMPQIPRLPTPIVCNSAPLFTSQTFIVSSLLLDTRMVPCGLNARALIDSR